MKAILLSGYRSSEFNDPALGTDLLPTGERRLDNQIQQLQALGFEVICVVSGPDAEEQLRHCARIADTELVFDTNDNVSLASNLKAGLAATNGEGCFVIPVEIAAPPADVWRFLNQEWRRIGFTVDAPVIQATDAQGAPWHSGFPLIITRRGNELIRKMTSFHSLTDPRLSYLHLAPPAKDA
jgi:hypothetical protein